MKSILELAKRHSSRVATAQTEKRRRGRDYDPFAPWLIRLRRKWDRGRAEAKLEFFEAWATNRLKR